MLSLRGFERSSSRAAFILPALLAGASLAAQTKPVPSGRSLPSRRRPGVAVSSRARTSALAFAGGRA